MNPKFTGVWIPVEVLQMDTLSVTDKVVYGIVNALDNEDGCFASNGYLASTLGLSERQIKNIIKTLCDYNLVVRVEVGGHRVLRTVEKQALVRVMDFTSIGKPISRRGGNRLHPYIKEDNKEDIKTPLPYGESFKATWEKWETYRKQTKKPLTALTKEEQLKMLTDLKDETRAVETINKSIAFGWQGLFVTTQQHHKKNTPLTNQDHANGF
jgi:biotin operon repressor